MNVSIKDKSSFQKEIEVTISPEEMQGHLEHAARVLGAQLSLKGFRPGKAPLSIVKEAVGEGRIWEEAAEEAVQKSFVAVCREHKLELIASPKVEVRKLAPGNEFSYQAIAEVVPAIMLPDWRSIAAEVRTKEHKDVQVEEKEVQDSLQWLADSRAKLVAVDRGARQGDYVEVSYEGRIADVKQEGLQGSRDGFILGKGAVLPEFEEHIVDMKRGERKEFSATFPADHALAHARGKEVLFHMTLDAVQERDVPALDDAFASAVGRFQTLEELTKNIHEGMQAEKEKKEQERVLLATLYAVGQKAHIEIPSPLMREELAKMKEEFEEQIGGMGLTFERYLEHIKKSEDEVLAGWNDRAKERVEAALVLRAIGEEEHIEPSEEEVQKRTNSYLARYANSREAEKNEGPPDAVKGRIRAMLRNEKVMELINTSF